ncbi:extracellular solute-binding protein [Kribbella sp. NPDC054772]
MSDSVLPSAPALSRRRLLAGAAGLAAVVGVPALSGCSNAKSTAGASAQGAGATLPVQVPFAGTKPDLAGDQSKGINAAYFGYPTAAEQVQTVHRAVGTGGPMTAFVITYSPPPPAFAGNAYWKAVNQALNVELKPTLVPQDFGTKLAAVLASNDIPDIVTMNVPDFTSLKRAETVAQARFADLSEYLSGDAVKDYPNLARLPQNAWKPCVVKGKLLATPTLRIPTGSVVYTRRDLIEKLGGNPEPTSAAEFEQLCAAITDPAKKRYALANTGGWMSSALIYPMFGVPNNWRRTADGTLTKDWETPEWKEAIAYTAKLWKKGYFQPDSTSSSYDASPDFASGSLLMNSDSFVRYTVRTTSTLTPGILPTFSADGKAGQIFEGPITDFVTFVKKGSADRVKETLRVLDWLSAPFGSKENFLRSYGVDGTDYALKNGLPTLTDQGAAETYSLSLRFLAGGPDVLYAVNGNTDIVKQMHAYQTANSGHRITDPTAGLISETALTTTALSSAVTDTITDVVVGRKQMSALDEAVAKWKKGGGDKSRAEYQEALASR